MQVHGHTQGWRKSCSFDLHVLGCNIRRHFGDGLMDFREKLLVSGPRFSSNCRFVWKPPNSLGPLLEVLVDRGTFLSFINEKGCHH